MTENYTHQPLHHIKGSMYMCGSECNKPSVLDVTFVPTIIGRALHNSSGELQTISSLTGNEVTLKSLLSDYLFRQLH